MKSKALWFALGSLVGFAICCFLVSEDDRKEAADDFDDFDDGFDELDWGD